MKGIVAPPAGADPDPDDLPVPDPVMTAGPRDLDLAREGIGTVIWATGFGPDLGWIGLLVTDERGAPVQEGGRSVVPGVWFLGVPWQGTRTSSIVLGADEDASAIVDNVARFLLR